MNSFEFYNDVARLTSLARETPLKEENYDKRFADRIIASEKECIRLEKKYGCSNETDNVYRKIIQEAAKGITYACWQSSSQTADRRELEKLGFVFNDFRDMLQIIWSTTTK